MDSDNARPSWIAKARLSGGLPYTKGGGERAARPPLESIVTFSGAEERLKNSQMPYPKGNKAVGSERPFWQRLAWSPYAE